MKGITWINVLVGIWLIVAAIARGAMGVAMANDVVLGVLLIAFSWWILGAVAAPVGTAWFEMLCGVWLIVAPFALGYNHLRSAMANDVVMGIVTIVVAAIAARTMTQTPRATV
jgi:SPW repeat-containing protein